MKDTLTIEGKTYISSRRAAEMTKYSNDYIGQLCRGGKVSARMMGRTWFVEEQSILEYKKSSDVAFKNNGKKISAQSFVPKKDTTPKQVSTESILEASGGMSEIAKVPVVIPPPAWKISYSKDERPLLPTLTKETTKVNVVPVAPVVIKLPPKIAAKDAEKVTSASRDLQSVLHTIRQRTYAAFDSIHGLSLVGIVSVLLFTTALLSMGKLENSRLALQFGIDSMSQDFAQVSSVHSDFATNMTASAGNAGGSWWDNVRGTVKVAVLNFLGIGSSEPESTYISTGTTTIINNGTNGKSISVPNPGTVATTVAPARTNPVNSTIYVNQVDPTIPAQIDELRGELDAFKAFEVLQTNAIYENLETAMANLTGSGGASSGTTGNFSGDVTIGGSLTVTGGATSSFANGINISAGCYAVNGTCITNASGISTSSLGLTTTDVAEGSNLYYTNGRVDTEANAFINSSSSIAKTYTDNTFGGTQTFAGTASINNLVVSSLTGVSTRCLQVAPDGTVMANASACGSGGSTGGGTFATTSSSVLGEAINAPLLTTDIVAIGGVSTSTAKFYFDPNIQLAHFSGALSLGGTLTVGALNGPLQAVNGLVSGTSTISVAYGGTGISTAPTFGQLLVGNTNGGYTLTSTSSLGLGTGSVTSVDASGGTTGLTFSGGPITNTGILTLAGTLNVTNGGTGINNPSAAGILLGSYAGGSYQQIATSSLGLLTTNVAEGSNQYFTIPRAISALTGQNVSIFTNDAGYLTTNGVNSFIAASTTIPKTYTSNTFTALQTFNAGLTTNALTLGALNGPLQANNGVVSATTSIGVLYGGTGLTTAPTSGQILVGNSSGGYTLTSTSSLGLASFAYLFPNNATSTLLTFNGGLDSYASTTIGNGTAKGGLTISGSATTTGDALISGALTVNGNAVFNGTSVNVDQNLLIGGSFLANLGSSVVNIGDQVGNGNALAFFANTHLAEFIDTNGHVGIGTTSPWAALSVEGTSTLGNNAIAGYFTATTTATSTFAGGIATNLLKVTSTTASSTFADGINLTSGCYAINNVCVTSGSSYGDTNVNSFINGSTTIPKTYTSNTFTNTNTFTALQTFNSGITSNALTIGSLTGPLQAINGVVSASSTLSVAYGGTGISTAPTFGQLLVGNSSGGYTLTSTSSLGLSTFAYLFPNNATSTLLTFNGGLDSYASTTIGNGTAGGGLTVSGNSTTTGTAYFAGNVGIGNPNPAFALDVAGNGSVSGNMDATSYSVHGTTALNISLPSNSINFGDVNGVLPNAQVRLYTLGQKRLVVDNTGFVGIGNTAPAYNLDVTGLGHFTGLVDAANFVATSTSATSTFAGNVVIGTPGVSVNGASNSLSLGTISGTGSIVTSGNGSLALGYSQGSIGGTGSITSSANGSLAGGRVNASFSPASISGDGNGSLAWGYALSSGNTISLSTSNNGSIALGYANNNNLTSSGLGSFAAGAATTGGVVSSGTGSFAFGDNINATANYATAFGSGFTNSTANTFKVGYGATPTLTVNSTSIGIGTTTPWAKLSIAGTAGGTTNLFTISTTTSGNATSTAFIIDANGKVGIGTSSPSSQLAIAGGFFTTATSTGMNGINLTAGCFAINNLCVTSGSSYGDTNVNSFINGSSTIPKTYTTNTFTALNRFNVGLASYASSTIGNGTASGGLTVSGNSTTTGNAYFAGNVGIGVLPTYALQVQGNGAGNDFLVQDLPNSATLLSLTGDTDNGNFIGQFGTNDLNLTVDKANQNFTFLGGEVDVAAGGATLALNDTTGLLSSILNFASNGMVQSSVEGVAGGLINVSGSAGANLNGGGLHTTSIGDTSGAGNSSEISVNDSAQQIHITAGGGTETTFTTSTTTKTSLGGYNIQNGGCYAVNGVCLSSTSYGDTNVNSFINGSSTIPKTYATNTFTALQTFNGGLTTNALTLGSLNGPLQAINGVVSASSTLSVAYGGTGLSSIPTLGQLLVGNSSGGYTLTSTSSLGLTAAAAGSAGQVQFNVGGAFGASSNLFWDNTNSRLGIGTSSPYAQLSVAGLAVFDTFNATNTVATSSIAGGLNVGNGALSYDWNSGVTSISSLTTGNMSFDTDAGIVSWTDLPILNATAGTVENYTASLAGLPAISVYGIADGAGSVRNVNVGIGSTTPPYARLSVFGTSTLATNKTFEVVNSASTTLFQITDDGKVGVGTTSAFATFAVNPVAGQALNQFVVGSSTKTSFIINNAGNVGVGTTSPGSLFAIGSVANFSAATSSFYGTGGINLAAGCFAVNGTCLTSSNYGDTNVNSFINGSTTIPKTYTANTFTALNTFNSGITSNALTLGTLNGPLQANNGVVSATTSVGVLYGGTGLTTAPTLGQLLVGNSSGGYTLTSTSSLGLSTFAYLFPNNATSTLLTFNGGLRSFASTTIGDGTQAGGLTISGGATTTGNAYFAGNVGIGTNNPVVPLDIGGYGTSGLGYQALVGLRGNTSSLDSIELSNANIGGGNAIILGGISNNALSLLQFEGGASGTAYGFPTWSVSEVTAQRNLILGSTGVADDVFITSNLERARIDQDGNFGIGTTSPYAKLSVNGLAVFDSFNATNTVATSSIAGGLNVGNGGLSYDWNSGITSVASLQTGALSFDLNAGVVSWADLPIDATVAAGTTEGYSAQLNGNPVITVVGLADGAGNIVNQRVGIGTSTPFATLTVTGSTTSATSNAFAVTDSAANTRFIIQDGGNVGVGTTSPGSLFAIGGVANFSTATTTFYNAGGLNLTGGGCYAVNGVCLTSAGASFGYLFPNNATSTLLTFNGGLDSYASTTIGNGLQIGGLTISGGATTTGNAYFAGNVGIGSTTPYAKLGVAGLVAASNFNADATTSTSTLAGGVNIGNGSISYDWNSGVTSIPYLEMGNLSFPTDAGLVNWIDLPVDAAVAAGTPQGYLATLAGLPALSIYGTADGAGSVKSVGVAIGSTTAPYARLTVFGTSTLASNKTLEIVNSASTTLFQITDDGKVGVGTTSPFATFAVNPVAGQASNQFVVGSSTKTSFVINNSGMVGIGTTSPFSTLSVNTSAGVSPFSVGSSTGSYFMIDKNGNVGVGTTSPTAAFSVASTSYFAGGLGVGVVNNSPGTLSVAGATTLAGVTTMASNITATGATFAINSSFGGGTNGAFTLNAFSIALGQNGANFLFGGGSSDTTIGTVTTNKNINLTTQGTGNILFNNGKVGIGTTTPNWMLQVASSSASNTMNGQFALTDTNAGANLKHWVFASEGGNFYLGTSSDAFATSTIAALSILSNGNVGIGSSSPYAKLGVGGLVAASNFNADATTSTSTFQGGVNIGNGAFTYDWNSGSTTIPFAELGNMNFAADSGLVSWVDLPITTASASGVPEGYSATLGGLPAFMVYGLADGAGSVKNVGISIGSTTAPSARLSIFGTSTLATNKTFEVVNSASTTLFQITDDGKVGVGTTTSFARLSVDTSNLAANVPSFVVGSSTRTDFLINQAGFVGIGTANPTYKLDIGGLGASTILANAQLAIRNSTNVSGGIDVQEASNGAAAAVAINLESLGGAQRVMLLQNGAGNVATTWGFNNSSVASLLSTDNLLIGNLAAFNLVFGTNNTERARFTAAGNFGIGTTTPNWMLQVASSSASNTMNGQFALTDTNAGTNLKHWVFSSNSGSLYIATSSDLLATSSIAALTINSNTNVGIGSTTPYAKLGVAGLIAASAFNADATTSTSTLQGGLNVGNGGLTYDSYTGITSVAALQTGNFNFDTDAGAVSWTDLAVDSSAPNGTPQSYTANLNSSAVLTIGGLSDGAGNVTNVGVGIGSTTPYGSLAISPFSTSYPAFNIATTTGPFAGTFFKVTGNGLTGIGTSSPWALLSVNATSSSNTPLFAVASTTGTATSTAFLIDSNGKVGIGTSSPSSQLAVQGGAMFSGNVIPGKDNTFSLGVAGDRWSTVYSQTLNTGDLVFGNNWRLLEATTSDGSIDQGEGAAMHWKNQSGVNLFNLDSKGNLALAGDICTTNVDCFSSFASSTQASMALGVKSLELGTSLSASFDTMNANFGVLSTNVSDLASSTASLASRITALETNGLAFATTSLDVHLSQVVSDTLASSSVIDQLASSTAAVLLGTAGSTDSGTTNSTTTATTTSPFIARVASALFDYLKSSTDWVFARISSSLAIFDRVETQTAAVSNGLEMTDSATGLVYCVRITNGDFAKIAGGCGSVASSTPSVASSTAPLAMPVVPPTEPVSPITPPVATSTIPSAPISTSTPVTTSTSTPPSNPVNPGTGGGLSASNNPVTPPSNPTSPSDPTPPAGGPTNPVTPPSNPITPPSNPVTPPTDGGGNSGGGNGGSSTPTTPPTTPPAPAPAPDAAPAGN